MQQLLKALGALGLALGAIKLVEDLVYGNRTVFVSFDYENDKNYKFMLNAWSANPHFDFKLVDRSSDEVQSDDIGRVKAALTSKIREADVLLVLVGAEANRPHRDRARIGYPNWINFEVARAKEAGKPIVAVKLDRSHESPAELRNAGASWAMSFTPDAVSKALRAA